MEIQLPLLKPLYAENREDPSIHDIVVLSSLSSSEKRVFSSVWTAMKLLLVMPATNVTSEHVFFCFT